MAGFLNLLNAAYDNDFEDGKTDNDFNTLVEDIVYELVTTNAKLINDTERGIIPHKVLEDEIVNYIDKNRITLEGNSSRDGVIKKVKNYLFGFGPLQECMDHKDISDIKIINKDNVRIKLKGKRKDTNIRFPSDKSLITYCYYLCIKFGGSTSELNAIQKLFDKKLHKDFILRLDVCLPPVTSDTPLVHIRKTPKKKYLLDDLYNLGMFDDDVKSYIVEAVGKGLNIMFCGKGAAGKTTLMNACLECIPHDKSVLAIQEFEELHTNHPECFIENVKYKSSENDRDYTLRDLTINGLLQDIDYMLIGEVKGEEALELFNAIYSGCTGWLTGHTASAKAAPNKLLHLMKYSKTDISEDTLIEMLSELDVIIFLKDFKVIEVVEIKGYDYSTKEILFNPIFKYSKGYYIRLNDSCEKVKSKIELNS